MDNDLRNKTALVWDNGLFVHVAVKLAEQFGRVLYGGPYVTAFPKSNSTLQGDGLPGIERILDIDAHLDADIFVFPDVMFGPMQMRLVKDGKRVFGGRMGENLELHRWDTKQLLKRLNMPVPETHLIFGMAGLRRFLQQRHGKWWLKTSRYRGDFETFSVDGYELAEEKLDELEYKLGKKKKVYPFIVERHIEAIVEVGYDGSCIDGKFADIALLGKEEKDAGLVGVMLQYSELPEPVKWVNEKLSKELAQYQYRGFFSTEIRCQNKESRDPKGEQFENFPMVWNEGETVPDSEMFAFLTDPCARAASPPSELYIEWFANWPEMIWKGAIGEIVQPEPIGKWGVEIMLHSAWADGNWQSVSYPENIAQWIKLRNMTKIDGQICTVPQSVGLPEIGGAVAIDDVLIAACRLCKERSEAVQGYFIEAKTDAIPKAIAAINHAQQNGITFTDEDLPNDKEMASLLKETP